MEIRNTRRVWGSLNRASTALYFFAVIQAIYGNLIEQPENTVAMFDSAAILKCKSDRDRKLQWHSIGNNSQEEELWSGYALNPKACPCPCCEIDNHETGKYNLNITARKETAKRYRCTEPGTLTTVSADLIVIGSALNTTCTYNKTEKDVALLCAIRFYGEWAPEIKWNNSDGEEVRIARGSMENGQVISTLTMPLTTNEVSYTATPYFDETNKPAEVTAANVPSYYDEWKSPPFKLDDPPINIVAIVVSCCLVLAGGLIAVFAVKKIVKQSWHPVLKQKKKTSKCSRRDDNVYSSYSMAI